jgi:hypothetical protein
MFFLLWSWEQLMKKAIDTGTSIIDRASGDLEGFLDSLTANASPSFHMLLDN